MERVLGGGKGWARAGLAPARDAAGRRPTGPGGGREGTRRAGGRRGRVEDGEGRGRPGHGPGRLWPWPRRPGVRGEVRETPGRRAGDVRRRRGGPLRKTCGTLGLPGSPDVPRRSLTGLSVREGSRGREDLRGDARIVTGIWDPRELPRRSGPCRGEKLSPYDSKSPRHLPGGGILPRLRGVPHGTASSLCRSPRNPHVPGISWRPQPARVARKCPGPHLGRPPWPRITPAQAHRPQSVRPRTLAVPHRSRPRRPRTAPTPNP
jgi:hypothetical protein